jgi:hypothetical protein
MQSISARAYISSLALITIPYHFIEPFLVALVVDLTWLSNVDMKSSSPYALHLPTACHKKLCFRLLFHQDQCQDFGILNVLILASVSCVLLSFISLFVLIVLPILKLETHTRRILCRFVQEYQDMFDSDMQSAYLLSSFSNLLRQMHGFNSFLEVNGDLIDPGFGSGVQL